MATADCRTRRVARLARTSTHQKRTRTTKHTCQRSVYGRNTFSPRPQSVRASDLTEPASNSLQECVPKPLQASPRMRSGDQSRSVVSSGCLLAPQVCGGEGSGAKGATAAPAAQRAARDGDGRGAGAAAAPAARRRDDRLRRGAVGRRSVRPSLRRGGCARGAALATQGARARRVGESRGRESG